MTLPDGWLTDTEAHELARIVRGKTVLELGAWKGRSTVVISRDADYVVSVDRHQGIAEVGGEDSLPDYLEAVRGLPNVAVVVASFETFCPLLSDFDVVYVDGNHDERSAARDARIALMHTHDEGVVAFHDWDFQTVRDGVLSVMRRMPNRVQGSLASFHITEIAETEKTIVR